MANFVIAEATSVARSGFAEHGFNGDSAQADKLVVNADAFLVAQGQSAAGAYLAPTLGWNVTANGSIFSLLYAGIYLAPGNAANSTFTIGEEGTIGGVDGLYARSSATIKNSGVIGGRDHGIRLADAGTQTITNSGTINGGLYSILDETATSVQKVTNSGVLTGHVELGGGSNTFSNTGQVTGDVIARGGNDIFSNSGTISGDVMLGDGSDKFDNTGEISGEVVTGAGNDTLTNKGQVLTFALGSGSNSLGNSGVVGNVLFNAAGNNTIVNSGKVFQIVDRSAAGANSTVTNSGTITQDIELGDGNDTVANSGTIRNVILGGGINKLTNTGVIGGVQAELGQTTIDNKGKIDTLTLQDGQYTIINSGVITQISFSGSQGSTFTNTGKIVYGIQMGSGNDVFNGGSQAEIVLDSGGSDTYRLGAGDDEFVYQAGFVDDASDYVDGGAGIDVYRPSGMSFINLDNVTHTALDVTPFANFAVAHAANTASGSIAPGAIKDTIVNFENVAGSVANETIYGSAGGNVLDGRSGNDSLLGLGGNDQLLGDVGDDKLHGGLGRDILTGGAGADGFFYSSVAESGPKLSQRDTITDFENGLDYISLVRIDANTKNGTADDAFNFIGFNVKFSGAAGELRAVFAADGVIIEGDVNGDKKADLSIFFQDPTHTLNASTLTAADFWL